MIQPDTSAHGILATAGAMRLLGHHDAANMLLALQAKLEAYAKLPAPDLLVEVMAHFQDIERERDSLKAAFDQRQPQREAYAQSMYRRGLEDGAAMMARRLQKDLPRTADKELKRMRAHSAKLSSTSTPNEQQGNAP